MGTNNEIMNVDHDMINADCNNPFGACNNPNDMSLMSKNKC